MTCTTVQAVATLAIATAACSAAPPNPETPQPRSVPAQCPRSEASWTDASTVGASATDLTTQLGRARRLDLSQGDAAKLFPGVSPTPNALDVTLAAGVGKVVVTRCPGAPVLVGWPVRVSLAAAGAPTIAFDGQLVATARDSATVTGLAPFSIGATSVGLWLGKDDAELLAGNPPVRWSTLCKDDPDAVAGRVLGKPLAQVFSEVSRAPLACRKEGGTAAGAIVPATPRLSLLARTGSACRQQANPGVLVVPVQIAVQSTDGWISHALDGTVTIDERSRTATLGGTGRVPISERTQGWLGCPSASGTFAVSVRAGVPASAGGHGAFAIELVSDCEDSSIRCSTATP
ncbi:MAG TPA: hypothetical protein VER33_03910 [Polyangiaceae bacterium]|nr:hypothetical protein [Polyangiaceae bacterium]